MTRLEKGHDTIRNRELSLPHSHSLELPCYASSAAGADVNDSPFVSSRLLTVQKQLTELRTVSGVA
jgi:hypothetical protein